MNTGNFIKRMMGVTHGKTASGTLTISLLKNNPVGITSETFKTLMTPKFTPVTNIGDCGLRITTLIDKKTNQPVNAFVAKVEDGHDDQNHEKYIIMVRDDAGSMTVVDKHYRIVGNIHFYINHKQKMITPKFENVIINGQPFEKVMQYMKSLGNKEFGGIGLRLHQIRIERMLHHDFRNVMIVADGNSFPFNYAMGYRLASATRPEADIPHIVRMFSNLNHKTPQENAEFVFLECMDKKIVVNWSATLEHFLNDYYKNGGEPLEFMMPNMFLTQESANQWIAMINNQHIL